MTTSLGAQLKTGLAVKYNEITHRTLALPLLIYYPTARCNSRCVSCDWWRADGHDDLTLSEIEELVEQLPPLGVRRVVFSGGEPLLRRDVYEIAQLFRARDIKLYLLTSGLFLERDADRIAGQFDQVTVSLDGPTDELYREIRGVDGLALIERGIRKLRQLAPHVPLRARATLHRHNFRVLPDLIARAREMGLDQISFLAADVTSEAFGRQRAASARGLLLDEQEILEFEQVVETTISACAREFETRFVAESPDKLRRLPRYYAAQLGLGAFPPIACNAPWVSAVVEADGAVRPCYFHPAVGSIRAEPLAAILSGAMASFRASLDISQNPTCRKCVCTLKVGLRTPLW
jgi:MoaA/NifB/PqqE/SkfB family radical SAM enzyme